MRAILFLFLLSFIVSSCEKQKRVSQREVADSSGIQFRFDKRVETVYIVLMLTGKYDFLISEQQTSYKHAAQQYFAGYKSHTAVEMGRRLIEEGFSFDYAVSWLCQFSDFPNFQSEYEVDFPFYDSTLNGGRNISKNTLDSFQQELIHFYNETHCDRFFLEQESFSSKMLTQIKDSLSNINLPETIEAYYGINKNALFTVILSPLLHGGGYEIDCSDKQTKQLKLVAMIGPNGNQDSFPMFDKEFLEHDLILHEFGHSYENDLVNDFMPQTLPYKNALFPPIQKLVEDEGCSEWTTFMHELIDRAVTIRIVERVYGKQAAEKLLAYEKSVGFRYVEDIADELKKYEEQRSTYPTLKSYFPNIIQRLGSIKVKD